MRRRFKTISEEPNPITIRHKEKNSTLDSDQKPYYDGRNAKRLRFYEKGLDHSAAATRRTILSPRSDVPKTSEYAYFKNVKNRNVNVHSGNRSNSSEAHYLNTGSNNDSDVRKLKSKDFGFLVSEERIRPSAHHTLVSPRVNLTFNTKQRSPLLSQHITPRGQHLPPVHLQEASAIPVLPHDSTCHTKQQSSFLSQNLTPGSRRQHFPSSPLNKAIDISGLPYGNQCSKKGIFSEKRQRLLQWVVRTSPPDVQNIHHNGSDLVASLLNRLFPKIDVSYGLSTERSDNSKSLLVHKSKDSEKEPKVPRRFQDEHLPIILYGNSNEIVPSEWNIISSHKFGSGNLIEYDTMDFDLLNTSESSSQKQLQFCHLKELDELCSPVAYAREEPRNRFLLDWNPERQKTGVYSSIVNRDAASLATSWHDDYQKMVDHEFDTKALCSSLEFNSLPNYESPNDLIQDFEPGLEHVKYSVAEPDQFALTFPYNPKGVSLEDYRNAENALFSIEDMIVCRDNHQFENKAWNGKLKNDLWQKFLYASDISEEDTPSICHTWRFPRAEQYTFSGNSFDHNFSSSNYHERLISNFRNDRLEIDFYPDDDHKLEYGQVL